MKRPDNTYIIKGHGTFIKDIGNYNNALLNYLVNKNDFNKTQLNTIKKRIANYLEKVKETIQSLQLEDHESSSK